MTDDDLTKGKVEKLRKAAAVVTKQLDDQEYSIATGAQYPRTRRSFFGVLGDMLNDDDERDDNGDDEEDEMDIDKAADRSGPHGLAAALLDHLHDALSHKRRRHGFEKSEKETAMDSIHSIMKSGGIGPTCAAIVAKGSTSISEHALVDAATAVAAERHPELSPAQAFSKVFTASTDEARVLREAIDVAKYTGSVIISGGDLRDANDAAQAMDQLREIGRRMLPSATPEKQFSVAFSDPKNAALAMRVHQRPSATTSYQFPVR